MKKWRGRASSGMLREDHATEGECEGAAAERN